MRFTTLVTAGILLAALACAPAGAADTVRTEAAGLRFTLPAAWTRVPAAIDTRAAQYRLPRVAGDTADTDFVLSFLGEGKGGGVRENLERWYDRFVQPDSRPSREAGHVTTRTVNGLHVTALDLAGTYVGSATGLVEAGVSGYRLLGAVVEGKHGPWFFQLLGPAASVGEAQVDFDALLASLEAHR